jgi:hypothetical protein
MKLNKLEKKFKNKAIKRGGILFFNHHDAIDLILECKKAGYKILGIDGFFLDNNKTQPSSSFSK